MGFNIDEIPHIYAFFAYICRNEEAEREYKSIIENIEVTFPDNISTFINAVIKEKTCNGTVIHDLESYKKLFGNRLYSQLIEINIKEAEISYKYIIDRIKGNVSYIDDRPLILEDSYKEAFKKYIKGNLIALINTRNEYKFIHWNGKAWVRRTKEDAQVIYGDFIRVCRACIDRAVLSSNDLSKLRTELVKKVDAWDSDNKCGECLKVIQRERTSINMSKYKQDARIICSNNGYIINLITGEIRETKKSDMVISTRNFSLVSKEVAEKEVEDILKIYDNVLVSKQKKDFLINILAWKLLGRRIQAAVFLIGPAATGKSTFSYMAQTILEDSHSKIPYEYFTTLHRGNEDTSRDDILCSLDKKVLILSSEGEHDSKIVTSRFKRLLGGTTERARKSNGNIQEIDMTNIDCMIDTNHMPQFTLFDSGVMRRILAIKFINFIPVEQRNPNYQEQILNPKKDEIISYFIYRALELRNLEKLEVPDVIKVDTKEIVENIDSFTRFVNEKIQPCEDSFSIIQEEFKKEYDSYCKDEGIEACYPSKVENSNDMAAAHLFNTLRDMPGFQMITKKRKETGSGKKYAIFGIMLKEKLTTEEQVLLKLI